MSYSFLLKSLSSVVIVSNLTLIYQRPQFVKHCCFLQSCANLPQCPCLRKRSSESKKSRFLILCVKDSMTPSVDKCLHMCGLWTQRNALIGSLGVEFRKRTTIGVELAAKVLQTSHTVIPNSRVFQAAPLALPRRAHLRS